MGWSDRGDHRDLRPDQPGQRPDLARRIHAKLVDAVDRVPWLPREAQRHAPVVVVAGGAGVGRPLAGEGQPERLLGAGLADAAGDRGEARAAAGARGLSERGQRLHRVGDHDQRSVGRNAFRQPVHQRRSAALQCAADEIVTVVVRPAQGDEQLARGDAAGIDRDARDGPVALGAAAGRVSDLAGGPERPAQATAPCTAASAARTSTASSNGSTTSPTIWPVSCPLPATTRTIAGAQLRHGGADRRAPVADLDRTRAGGEDRPADRGRVLAARVVVGDEYEVGARGGDLAHHRPLAGITVAAAAEHHHEAAVGVRPQRVQDLRQRVRLVGVVDEDRRAAGMHADPLQPPGGALEALEEAGRGGGVGARCQHEAERRQEIGGLEGADQPGRDLVTPAVDRELKGLAVRPRLARQQTQALGLPAVVEHGDAALPADRGQRREFRLIGVEHGGTPGRQELAEEAPLGRQIAFETAVIIEVVS